MEQDLKFKIKNIINSNFDDNEKFNLIVNNVEFNKILHDFFLWENQEINKYISVKLINKNNNFNDFLFSNKDKIHLINKENISNLIQNYGNIIRILSKSKFEFYIEMADNKNACLVKNCLNKYYIETIEMSIEISFINEEDLNNLENKNKKIDFLNFNYLIDNEKENKSLNIKKDSIDNEINFKLRKISQYTQIPLKENTKENIEEKIIENNINNNHHITANKFGNSQNPKLFSNLNFQNINNLNWQNNKKFSLDETPNSQIQMPNLLYNIFNKNYIDENEMNKIYDDNMKIDAIQNSNKFTCQYNIQINNEKKFQVAKKIIGSKGCNMKTIIKSTLSDINYTYDKYGNKNDLVKLRLRGKGSGFKEGPDNKESNEPLHLCLSTKYNNVYEVSCKHAEKLIKKIYKEYYNYCKKHKIDYEELKIVKIKCFDSDKLIN